MSDPHEPGLHDGGGRAVPGLERTGEARDSTAEPTGAEAVAAEVGAAEPGGFEPDGGPVGAGPVELEPDSVGPVGAGRVAAGQVSAELGGADLGGAGGGRLAGLGGGARARFARATAWATRRDASGNRNRQAADARVIRHVRWRLVAWSGGATLVVLAALGIAIYAAVAGSLAADGRQQLQDRAVPLARAIADARFRIGERGGPGFGFAIGGPGSGTIAFVVTPANLVVGSQDFTTGSLPDPGGVAAARSGQTDVREATVEGVPLRLLSMPVVRDGDVYVLQIAQETTAEHRTLGTLLTVLVLGGLLGVLVATAVGALYAQRALVPIRDSLRRQREFAADASHELRTPLAVIRSAVEYIQRHPDRPVAEVDDALGDVADEVEHLTALVGDLLLLARTDSGTIDVERLPLDLADIAADALSLVSPLASSHGVRLTLDPEPAPVIGDPTRLRQLVTILADNAIAHSPANGTVAVSVRSAGRTGTLIVEDEGPGIREEDLPRVFDRFWRAADSPSGGTGLGLAIAAWIVERHGGSIQATNRESGGAAFAVRLPLERSKDVSSYAGERAVGQPEA